MGQYSTDGISGSMAFKRRYTSGNTDSFALVTVTDRPYLKQAVRGMGEHEPGPGLVSGGLPGAQRGR